jgi:hypothetical protein
VELRVSSIALSVRLMIVVAGTAKQNASIHGYRTGFVIMMIGRELTG